MFLHPIEKQDKIAQTCDRLKLVADKNRNRFIGAFFSQTPQKPSVGTRSATGNGKAMQYEVAKFTPWLRTACGVLDMLSAKCLPNSHVTLEQAIYNTLFAVNSER